MYLSILLSTMYLSNELDKKHTNIGDMSLVIDRIISNLKFCFIHTWFIKYPITKLVLQCCKKIRIINYRSTSWVIYSGLQPTNTLSWCSLAMNQTNCSKRACTLVFNAFCLEKWTLHLLVHYPFRVAQCEVSDKLKPRSSSLQDTVFHYLS